MFNSVKKNIFRKLSKSAKVKPSCEKVFQKSVNYMDTLEQLWINKPNNFQGPILYETTFQAGGYTSFVTVPTGHCFSNPKKCRTAENSRQLAAQVALLHCMFAGGIFHDVSTESLDSTVDEIIHSQSVSNIKWDPEESFETMSYVLSNSQKRQFGSEHFQMLLKLRLMHWNGSFHNLNRMRYTKQQIANELTQLSVENLTELMALDWSFRESQQPGVISMELSRCRHQLFQATQRQQNVRVPKEKCLILLSALELMQ